MQPKKAVALRYEQQLGTAPKVVAKGTGAVAEAILNLAESVGVNTYKDSTLVDSLMSLEVDSVIPEELYAVVAEVLAYVYRQQGPGPSQPSKGRATS